MATALFTDAESICFNHDVIKIIRKIKNHYQCSNINTIHKKIIKIPDYHISTEFLNIQIIRNKCNWGNPSFTLNVTIEIPIQNNSYSVLHVETLSTEYNLQTPYNSPIHIHDTRNIRTNN